MQIYIYEYMYEYVRIQRNAKYPHILLYKAFDIKKFLRTHTRMNSNTNFNLA